MPSQIPRTSGFLGLRPPSSLERKLPLLMTGVLTIALVISLALTYSTLTEAARDAASVRLARAARQLAASIESSIAQRAMLQRRVAVDSAVRRALRSAQGTGIVEADRAALGVEPDSTRGMAAARAALAQLAPPTDSTTTIELWTADGRPLVRLGRDSLAPLGTRELPRLSPTAAATGTGVTRPDSVRVGAFYESGGRVFFGISTPIDDGAERLGTLAELHLVAASPSAEQGLRALIGEAVTARYRNENGLFWSTLGGVRATPLQRLDSASTDTVFRATGEGGTALLATEAAIGGTPWVIVLELPVSSVLARPRQTTLRLGVLSALILALCAVASWMISKRITKPLATLSVAAEALAHGDVTRHVDDTGSDEVAQLARTFNYMRDEITSTHAELEAQVEEAQTVTEELEQANEQLRQAMEAAETANRVKSDFLAVMSHELRTPLNAIGGYVQLLELGVHGPVNDAQRDALTRVARSQQRLLTLINDVLNFTRLDAGHVEYNWRDFSLDAALAGLEPVIAPQVRAKGLTYTYVPCSSSLTVHADHDRLQQIVINLLSNAIKFTPAGGVITVESEATPDAVLIRVRDTGRGIPADRARTIFEPFVQVERSLNRPHEGVGLGLSISRELARGMGGDLTVESEPDKGSVFTVRVSRIPPVSAADGRVAWASLTPDRTPAVRSGATT